MSNEKGPDLIPPDFIGFSVLGPYPPLFEGIAEMSPPPVPVLPSLPTHTVVVMVIVAVGVIAGCAVAVKVKIVVTVVGSKVTVF